MTTTVETAPMDTTITNQRDAIEAQAETINGLKDALARAREREKILVNLIWGVTSDNIFERQEAEDKIDMIKKLTGVF